MKKPKKPSKKILLFILLGVLVLAALIWFGMHHKANNSMEDMEMENQPTVAAAEIMTIENSITSDGEVKTALEESKVPRAGYKLKKIKVEKNQQVHEGDTILVYTNGAKMYAPYACVVEDWNLPNNGNKLTNDHWVKVAGTDILKMDMNVDESQILQVEKGDKAVIEVKATDAKYNGEVSFVSDIGDYGGGTSTFAVSVIFENDGNVKLGMNGNAKIILDRAKNVLGVPADAVHEENGKSYVSLTKSGDPADAEEVQVVTGLKGQEFIEIKKGLKEGDQVVYEQSEEDWSEDGMMEY